MASHLKVPLRSADNGYSRLTAPVLRRDDADAALMAGLADGGLCCSEVRIIVHAVNMDFPPSWMDLIASACG